MDRQLIYKDDARAAVLKADPEIAYCIDRVKPVDAVVVPCKIGDLVWGIRKFSYGQKVMHNIVSQMFVVEGTKLCICVKSVCRGEWGVDVFATEKEARAELERRKGGQQ